MPHSGGASCAKRSSCSGSIIPQSCAFSTSSKTTGSRSSSSSWSRRRPSGSSSIDSARSTPGAVLSIVVPLVQALGHAHAAGVVHRDVKPENIFVDGLVVKLADFGNARVVSLASVTGASLTWGTPEYVAPELFGRGRADPRSDYYSLGVILYEMLTGRRPWSRAEALSRLSPTARPPRLAPTGAGEAVDRLIADLVAPEPAGRPASGDELLFRLSDKGDTALGRSRPAPPAARAAGRRPTLLRLRPRDPSPRTKSRRMVSGPKDPG